jgi:hypothetical protein
VGIGAVVAALLLLAAGVRLFAPPAEPLPAFSGQRATRTYDLTGFTEIRAGGQWQVTLVRGEAWAVEVNYPAELEQVLDVREERGALLLRYDLDRSRWSDFGRDEALAISARVVMPALDSLRGSGATRFDVSGFEGKRLAIDASGASVIDGRDSRYDVLDIDISGAGHADLGGITTTDARVDVSGAQRVTLRMAGGTLSGDVSGASRVEYYGSVSSQTVRTSGIARVEHRE